MVYIPDDAKWYIAEIVMECTVEGEPRNVVHINILLVRADSPEEAFERAEALGKSDEDSYSNPQNQKVTWSYCGLRDLNVVHDELEHGAELLFEEEIGVSADNLQEMITEKSELNVFRAPTARDSSEPDYGNKEIQEEAQKLINGS
ncbi:MAG: DUF4288 domain-containing protein [Spirulina sp. SIO3F2]|nr:DUF4288 domain-containing protein [Spirulina sp. SIO3F2]